MNTYSLVAFFYPSNSNIVNNECWIMTTLKSLYYQTTDNVLPIYKCMTIIINTLLKTIYNNYVGQWKNKYE